MMTYQQQAMIILAIALGLSLFFWFYSDSINEWFRTADAPIAIFVYFLTQPPYLAIIGALAYTKKIRGLFASFFIVLGMDLMTLPHFVAPSGELPQIAFSFVQPEVQIIRMAPWLGSFGLYVALPMVLFGVALWILLPEMFVKSINSKFVPNGGIHK
jgi:hypothetical protein